MVTPNSAGLEGGVNQAIHKLDTQGVWESTDKSEWANQMVMPLKPDGSVQMTTDLSSLNEFIVPSYYPLPLLEDIYEAQSH